MSRQRLVLVGLAVVFAAVALVLARSGGRDAMQGEADSLPGVDGRPRSPTEGTDFPNIRPTPQGASEASRSASPISPAPSPASAHGPELTGPATAGARPELPPPSEAPSPGPEVAAFGQRDAGTASAPFPVTAQGIKAAMAEAMPEMKECYEQWLKASPQLQGTVKFGLQIVGDSDAGTGRVEQVNVLQDGGLGHLAFEGCVRSVMGELRFERPEGTITVHYPVTFSSDDDDGGR